MLFPVCRKERHAALGWLLRIICSVYTALHTERPRFNKARNHLVKRGLLHVCM